MTPKLKIKKYADAITKSETYNKYLVDAAEFGYSISEDKVKDLEQEIKSLKKIVSTYESLLERDALDEDEEDYNGY